MCPNGTRLYRPQIQTAPQRAAPAMYMRNDVIRPAVGTCERTRLAVPTVIYRCLVRNELSSLTHRTPMEYEECATCMCTDLQENTGCPPEQCIMCGGYREEQFKVQESNVNVGQVKSCCKWSLAACAGACGCCFWHIPYSEWLCTCPLEWFGQHYLETHIQGGYW